MFTASFAKVSLVCNAAKLEVSALQQMPFKPLLLTFVFIDQLFEHWLEINQAGAKHGLLTNLEENINGPADIIGATKCTFWGNAF